MHPERHSEPNHVIIDKDISARINVGILVSIITVAVLGALFLQDIAHQVTTANLTLADVKAELTRQNDSVIQHSEVLSKQSAILESLERRVSELEKRVR